MDRKHETQEGDGDSAQRRNAFKRALLSLTVILVAVFPFPWWW